MVLDSISPFLNTTTLAFWAVSGKSTVIVFWISGFSGVVASIVNEILVVFKVYPYGAVTSSNSYSPGINSFGSINVPSFEVTNSSISTCVG